VEYPQAAIGRQLYSLDLTPSRFVAEIAPARTFGFREQVEQLRSAGLIRGGALENALVCDGDRWLNPPLRFADEPVRHKLLDLLGDLALVKLTGPPRKIGSSYLTGPMVPLGPSEARVRQGWLESSSVEPLRVLTTMIEVHRGFEALQSVIQTYRQKTIDLEALVYDDKPTYDLLNRGDTVGVFQLESTGMRDLIRRIGISSIEDLIAMIALYRPGPMDMLPDFVNRKHGKVKIEYDHPLLEPILKETFGVIVYQEQVMRIASTLAGFDALTPPGPPWPAWTLAWTGSMPSAPATSRPSLPT
jgi:hypothetical protein